MLKSETTSSPRRIRPLADQRSNLGEAGFTLVEILVAGAVLALVVLLMTRLTNHATAVITQGNKHMDTESTARALFDRLTVDVAQMVKRTDVSYYLKNGGTGAGSSAVIMGNGLAGAAVNDRLAFFSTGAGYYDTANVKYNSSYSVVAYRVNADPASTFYNKVQRMAKGLPLNAAYTITPGPNPNNSITPVLFLNGAVPPTTTIDSVWPSATRPFGDPCNCYNPPVDPSTDPYQKYQLVASQVFRFEYYYLTSGAAPALVAFPPSWSDWNTVNIKDIAAIVVAVATIDSQSQKLLGATIADQGTQIANIIKKLPDYTPTLTNYGKPGALLAQWQNVLQTDPQITALPRPALQGIRLYERYFYLSQ
jgi:hypothetical protein